VSAALQNLASTWRRRWLWAALLLLVLGMLAILFWLASRYEVGRAQEALERDTQDAVADIRSALNRNVQDVQSLQTLGAIEWQLRAEQLLRARREMLRIERRGPNLQLGQYQNSNYRPGVFAAHARSNSEAEAAAACAVAQRSSAPGYSTSYFVPQADGLGLELMDQCLSVSLRGEPAGFLVVTYSAQALLGDLVSTALTRRKHVSMVEGDGTRLAHFGNPVRQGQALSAQQPLGLAGNTALLRLETEQRAPDVFLNVLTALVGGMSLALLGVLALLARDMRLRVRAQDDLAQALAFRKAMEDSLVTGLRARDLQGRITYVNPAFCDMVGFSAAQLLGQSAPAPFWPPELVDEYQKRQAIRLAGHLPPREGFESMFMRKNGERFPVVILEAPLIDAQNRQTGWMSAVLDVSEQRRMQEQSRASLERAQASARLATMGEMASLVSHELNQPLAAISSYATGSLNLLAQLGSDATAQPVNDDLREAMQRISAQAERAGQVIRSVNNFVRRREHVREQVPAQSLIDAVMPLVQLQARKSGIRVHTDIAADLPLALCDRTMVEQVLLNLTRNGMQAMEAVPHAQRELRIGVQRAEPADAALVFSVQDQGPGIAADVAQQLFTPFFSTKAEGLGLGLSLCRTVVEQHGGQLHFENLAQGGTVFRFSLPAAQGAAHDNAKP
jgi:two-component system, LuxR family, sensor histidine kinase DctS